MLCICGYNYYTTTVSWQVRDNCHTLHSGIMTSQDMTSSQRRWPVCSTQERIVESSHGNATDSLDVGHTGSRTAPRHFRSRDLLAEKTASFYRRIHEIESSGVGAELVSPAWTAYNRWSTAVENERRRGRASGVGYGGRPHDEGLFDDVHSWLIDILDASLQHSSVLACDLATGLSLTAVHSTPNSRASFVEFQTLLQRVTDFLQTSQLQVNISKLIVRSIRIAFSGDRVSVCLSVPPKN